MQLFLTRVKPARPPFAEVTGKPVGSDLAEGKVTLPLIAALRNATAADRRRLRALAHRKRRSAAQWDELRALIDKVGGFSYARDRAVALADEARTMLDDEPQSSVRRALGQAIDYAVRRDH